MGDHRQHPSDSLSGRACDDAWGGITFNDFCVDRKTQTTQSISDICNVN
jgi:hypothetical protein